MTDFQKEVKAAVEAELQKRAENELFESIVILEGVSAKNNKPYCFATISKQKQNDVSFIKMLESKGAKRIFVGQKAE